MSEASLNAAMVTTPVDSAELAGDLAGWLARQGDGCRYLLAHTERGVVWGRIDNTSLITSHDAFPQQCRATLDAETLIQARLFGPKTEVLLWRSDGSWHLRRFDEPAMRPPSIDERQMLWGTRAESRDPGRHFTLLQQGAEGMRHAVPLLVPDAAFTPPKDQKAHWPVRLLVRHYLDYARSGSATIGMSRLVDLHLEEVPHGAA